MKKYTRLKLSKLCVIKIILFISINLFATAILANANSIPESRNIRIVVTIKPLYNLVMAMVQGISTTNRPVLLLHGNVSPHDYNLKMSDIKLVAQADLIVWGGDQLEFFLTKLLKQQKFADKLLTVQDLRNLNNLTFRNKKYLDEHIWLSPKNAIVIVRSIEQTLAKLDPVNAKKYATNRKNFVIKLQGIDSGIRLKLKLLSHRNYLVFHDAYQYFEKFYGLQAPIVITDNPAIPLSIQRMLVIHDLINNQGIKCVFKEPQFSSKVLDYLLKSKDLNAQLKVGILDPLGSDQDLGADGYFKLINNLAESFSSCFKD